jgi:predicted O-linked N-acetylglucosamine transferase (SPINDLY family)
MDIAESYGATVLLAWEGKQNFAELIDYTSRLEAAGLSPLSALLYQTWLSRNQSPYAHAVNFNLGATLSNLGDISGAEAAYRRAIAMAPTFAQPRLNLGLLFERSGQVDAAMDEWKWIVGNCPRDEATSPLVQLAMNHLGRVLEGRKQFPEAETYLTQSLLLNPSQPDVLHHWVFLRQKQCAWPVYAELPGVSRDAMHEATSALAMLSVSDDPQDQLHAAQQFVETKLAKNLPHLSDSRSYGHKKLRVAYCSSDFCLHPVSLLTVQLFELHDRESFEVYGFCWSPEDGSATRDRVKQGMDHFFPIHQLSDEAAARLIRSHEIDILVDLQGQTSGARANILGYRPAPIQITYLGLPATTGLPSIDYVIADEFLIPPREAPFYTEKPLYMPHVYQVSDRKRVAGPRPTRASCGLPETGFVFCSFNNSYKYTPEVFAVWLSLLDRVPGSVLWLLADNPWAEKNLRQVAEGHGFAPDRLVFAARVSPENYLARYLIADLFLDTFPFNAGTTANDCLWMGCPLVTYTGRSFGSRMAGALLTAAGLSELITYNLEDYQALALALANDPTRCAALRNTLEAVREHGVLFDTPQFVRNLEARFQGLVAALIPSQESGAVV